jgi:hypothetical protein
MDDNTLYLIFVYGSYFSALIPIIALLFKYILGKPIVEKADLLVIIIMVISFTSDSMTKSNWLGATYNYPIINCYMILYLVCVAAIFQLLLKKHKTLIIGIFALFTFSLIIYLFGFNGIYSFNPVVFSLSAVVIIFFCLLYFYQIYHDEAIYTIYKRSSFYYIVALLVYSSGAFYSFLLAPIILSKSFSISFWYFHNFMNILKNLLFAVGILLLAPRVVHKL